MSKKYVYLFQVEGTNVYKIGNSKHPDKRLLEVQVGCPFKVVEIARYETRFATKIESLLHTRYNLKKEDEDGRELQGEFFALNKEDRDTFEENCKKADEAFILLSESNSYFKQKNGEL